MEKENKELPFSSILASAFITYLGNSDENQREQNLNVWKQSCRNNSFNFLKFLSSESTLLKWKCEGLPGDQLSLENSVSIFNSSRISLLIDPNI